MLFYTCADRKYEDYVPLYLLGALECVPHARVEVGLEDTAAFCERHAAVLGALRQRFGERFLLHDVAWTTADGREVMPNSIRFVTPPQWRADYVYIGDVDIVHLDRNFPNDHLEFMAHVGLPYANSMRRKSKRLTGLHFTAWDALYPLPEHQDLLRANPNDEVLLTQLCLRKGLALQDKERWRPVPGIHFSPNRVPVATRAADGSREPEWTMQSWLPAWRTFRAEPPVRAILELLVGKGVEIVATIDAAAAEDAADPPEERSLDSVFRQAMRRNQRSGHESLGGSGSSHAMTADLVPQLRQLLARTSAPSTTPAAPTSTGRTGRCRPPCAMRVSTSCRNWSRSRPPRRRGAVSAPWAAVAGGADRRAPAGRTGSAARPQVPGLVGLGRPAGLTSRLLRAVTAFAQAVTDYPG